MQSDDIIHLHQTLSQRLSDGEFRTLCFYLGVSYDDLGGEGLSAKARELLAYLDRRGRISDLIAAIERLRPDIAWDEALPRPSEPQRVVNLRPLDVIIKDRLREMRALSDHLADASVRLVSIVGRAGIGKTALASHVLADLEHGVLPLPGQEKQLPINGILYLSARSTGLGLERIYADVGRMLGEPAAGKLATRWVSRDTPLAARVEYLLENMRDGLYLILLDNLEDKLTEDGTIAEEGLRLFVECCLAQPGGARLIATSREQIKIAAAALRNARSIPLREGLPEDEAIALLHDLDPDGALGLRDAPEANLCQAAQLTQGIPRALEILAGILYEDPTANLSQLLADEDLFGEQVVEQLVAQGYHRLGEDERRVMEALAVFDRPVKETAIAHLLHPWFPEMDVRSSLRRLARSYFVTASRVTGEYSLHPLDRDYSYHQIPESEEPDAYARRNLELRAADFYASIRKPKSEWKLIEDLAPQLVEFEHHIKAQNFDTVTQLMEDIVPDFLLRWGYAQRIVSMYQQLLGKVLDESLENRMLGYLGRAYAHLGQYKDAIECYEQALAIARKVGNKSDEGDHLSNLGRAYRNLAQYDCSVKYHQQALSIARETGDRRSEGTNLCNLGITYRNLGQHEEAIKCLERSLVINGETRNRRGEGRVLMNLGKTFLETGLVGQAIEKHQEALAVVRKVGDRREEGNLLCAMGWAYDELGEYRQAIDLHEQGLTIMCDIGDRRGECTSLLSLGGSYLKSSSLQSAAKYLQQSREIAVEVGKLSAAHFANSYLTQAYLYMNRLQDALIAIVPARQYNLPLYNHRAAVLHGVVLFRLAQEEEDARVAFEEALSFADELLAKTPRYYHASYTRGLALTGLSLLTSDSKRSDLLAQARQAYKRARDSCDEKGVIENALRLFKELQLLDGKGVLASVLAVLVEAR